MPKKSTEIWRSLIGLRPVGRRRTVVGIGLIAMSVLALAAPLAAGTWSLQFLSIFPFAIGLTELYTALNTPQLRIRPSSYLTGFVAIAAAVLLFLSPALAAAGVVVLLLGFLVIDGALKLGQSLLGLRLAHVTNGGSGERHIESPARSHWLGVVAERQR